MELTCNGQLIIECDKCNHKTNIDCVDLPFEIVETEERQMGVERTHSADYEFNCANCGNEISIKYDFWEYPEGIINDSNIDISGGTVIQECNCGLKE